MEAKITYLWGDWTSYCVSWREDCRDNIDKSAYDELVRSDAECVQMGKVYVERIAKTVRK